MDCLFTALCFFCTARQFPVVIVFIGTSRLDLFFLMLTVCFVCLFLCVAPVVPVFPAWCLSCSGFQFGRCLADYISLIIVLVLISTDINTALLNALTLFIVDFQSFHSHRFIFCFRPDTASLS